MSRITTGRIVCCLALALCLGLYAAWAQEGERPAPAKGEAAQQAKRTFYVGKHGSAKVQELRRDGRLGDVRHVRLTAVEHQSASVLVGENKPFVSGIVNKGGQVRRSIHYRNVGTQVRVTARVADAKSVFLDLEVED